jgi:hypothetical protein
MDIRDIKGMKERAVHCKECLGQEIANCFTCEDQVAMEEIIELCEYTNQLHDTIIKKQLS